MLFAATPDLYGTEAVASIPGGPPRLDAPVAGCAFRPRCDVAIERCETDRPELLPISFGHQAACHRARELSTEPVEAV